MRINTNTTAITATRLLNNTENRISKNMEKLSSGLRINNAADDATGLVISQQMSNQIKGFEQAIKNAEQGSAMLSTAEGAMGQIADMVSRIRELVVSVNSGNMTVDNKSTTQDEITELLGQIDDIAKNTEYNTKPMLDGSLSGSGKELTFQVGANAGQVLEFNITSMKTTALGISGLSVVASGSPSGLSGLITDLDTALDSISSARSELGAKINRFEYTINNLEVSIENLQSSRSLITDVDMADEYVDMTTNQVLQQVSTSMLAQANSASQSILSLLQG